MISTKVIYILTVLAIHCKCRKYDIEEEAHKLYDDSFSNIVQKFRKTPEYLKILQSQMAKLENELNNINEQIFDLHLKDLGDAVLKAIKVNSSKSVLRSSTPYKERRRIKHRKRKTVPKRRENGSPIDRLDSYDKFHSALTLEERNKIKDLAYEFSGKAVHELMERWLPDGTPKVSTKLPDGGHQPTITTTEHVHVATTTTETTTNAESVTTETTTMSHHHHHHSTAAPESQRNFQIPKLNYRNIH